MPWRFGNMRLRIEKVLKHIDLTCHSEEYSDEEFRKHKVDVIEILPPFGRLDNKTAL